MSFKIAIASGKGGTGKTTVSINLYYFLSKLLNKNVRLVDCDVEEPNDLLFFPDAKKVSEKIVFQQVPKIDTSKCTYCKKCVEYCEFNAISVIPSANYAEINSSLCHSCGACSVACKYDAITEYPNNIGMINHFSTSFGDGLSEGRLKVGSAMQTLMIKRTKKSIAETDNVILLDSPPGTSCPVVESVSDANYVILVTEPTPFGLYDMKLMVNLLNELNKPFGVIVNKAGLGNDKTYQFIEEEGIELLGDIPFMQSYASDYANGNLFENIPNAVEKIYHKVASELIIKMNS